jgi:hypothetical protein
MMTRARRMICIGAMILMLTVGFSPFLPTVSATNDPANTHAHVDVIGDWTVLDTRVYDGGTGIHMTNGNVRVASGGKLTLDNAGILFSSASNGQHGIIVEDGGSLTLKTNGGFASFTGLSYYVGFLPNSTISITGGVTAVSGGSAPGAPYGAGIYVGTTNITVDGWTIQNNPMNNFPLLFSDAEGVVYHNLTIQVQNNNAISIHQDATFYDTRIAGVGGNNKNGIYISPEVDATIVNANIGSPIGPLNNGITAYTGFLTLQNVKIHNLTQTGIYIDDDQTLTMKDCEIVDNNEGMRVWGHSTLTMTGNNRVYYNNNYGLDVSSMATVNVTNARISFNGEANLHMYRAFGTFTKVIFEDAGGNHNVELEAVSEVTIKDSTFIAGGSQAQLFIDTGSDVTVTGSSFIGGSMAYIQTNAGATLTADNNDMTDFWLGYLATGGSTIFSSKNKMTDFHMAAMYSFDAQIYSTDDSGKTAFGNALVFYSELYGYIEALRANFILNALPNMVGTTNVGAELIIVDSQFTTTETNPLLSARYNSYIRAINCGIDAPQTVASIGGSIDLGWHTEFKVLWQNSVPIEGAEVHFTDLLGDSLVDLMSDDHGTGATDIIATTTYETGIVKHNPYNVSAFFDGMAGNVTASVVKNLVGANIIVITVKDKHAPSLEVVFPTDDYLTQDGKITINGTASDKGSGLDGVFVSVDSGAFSEANGLTDWDLDLDLSEGTHDIMVEARDLAGVITAKSLSVVVDKTAPVVTILTPLGLYQTVNKFNLSGTVDDKNATITVAGNGVTNNNGAFVIELDIGDGEHNITVEATDLVGNKVIAYKVVIVDTVAPTIICDVAQGTWFANTNLVLTGKSDGILVKVNGKDAEMDLANKTWKVPLTLTEGANVLNMTATDLAGNSKNLKVNVSVDTTAPVIVVTAPTVSGQKYTNKPSMNVTGKVTELHLATLTVNGVAVTPAASGNFSSTVSLTEGSNVLKLVAKDLAGNEAKWEFTTIMDDKFAKERPRDQPELGPSDRQGR